MTAIDIISLEIRAPKYCRADNSIIWFEYHDDGEWMRHSVGVEDVGEDRIALWQFLINGGAGPISAYVEPSPEQTRQSMPSLTARQLRLGLIDNGIMPSQVQATLNAMPAGDAKEKALVEWEFASSFERLHPLIASVGTALGLGDAQIDAMWAQAAQL